MAVDDMTPEEFRRHGHALVDWIAEYWTTLEDRPVLPAVRPGEVRAAMPDAAPEQPEAMADVLADLDRVVMPGVVHWQHPGWFAFFPASTSFASILGDLAAAGLAQQGMLWSTSPAATEVEEQVLDWLVGLLGLPAGWRSAGPGGGVIQLSASDSTHTTLVVARHRAGGSGHVAYTSAQAHSSVEKGARVAGYAATRLIPTRPGDHAMDVGALRAAIAEDRAAGLVPTWVCATVGTTGTTAVDPVRAIAGVARDEGLWCHVDAAYAGSAMICPELRHHQDGLELVDSYTANPHKWLRTGFDCSVLWVADRQPLIRTMSIVPPYLQDRASASGAVTDYRDWHVPLGRRFRALKLWFVLRAHGAEGLRAGIREHLRWAADLAAHVQAHPRLELVAPTPFALVSFAHVDGDVATDALAAAITATGHSHVTPSTIGGRRFVRVSIGSTTTEARHVERLWDVIDGAA